MKKIILSALISIFAAISFAQNNVGIGTNTPAASAALDISSTTKGLLIPRLTSVQRSAVTLPTSGLLVFDTDTKTIWTYDGVANTIPTNKLEVIDTITSSINAAINTINKLILLVMPQLS